jgi:hypothetical protein
MTPSKGANLQLTWASAPRTALCSASDRNGLVSKGAPRGSALDGLCFAVAGDEQDRLVRTISGDTIPNCHSLADSLASPAWPGWRASSFRTRRTMSPSAATADGQVDVRKERVTLSA